MKFWRNRLLLLALIFSVFFAVAVGRLFYLQIFKGEFYQGKAKKQQSINDTVLPERGNIYLSSLGGSLGNKGKNIPIALTSTWYNVWVSPKEIPNEEKGDVSKKLSEIFEIDINIISERIGKEGDPYEPIKDKVDKEKIFDIQNLKLKGVHWDAFQDRYYPLGEFASQVVGFVSDSGIEGDKIKTGKYGLEGYFNDELKGESGYIAGVKKALGSLIFPLSHVVKAKKGEDIFLTIDYNIQLTLERELKKTVEKFSAESASAIIMDPKTGAIMAMASVPSFDPNKFNEVKNISTFLNQNIQLVFEPGSIFKPITMAAALDINAVSPDLTYNDTGEVHVGPDIIRNSTLQSWGVQTMTQVLEKSLNTGIIFVLRKIPQEVWREYVSNFGFAEKTGITLIGESRGNLNNLKSGIEIDWLTSSFGQGISVTPIAIASAISAIANGGELIKPFLVSEMIDPAYADANEDDSRNIVLKGEKVVKRRVIKPKTSETLTKMLVSVVENGSGKQARITGYTVAGKTGTAQVSGPTGGYMDKTIHTFVGYSPAFNPAFLMLIKIDNPKGVEFSEATAAPVFKNVGEFILHYLNVSPDKPIIK
jgi:stage V sporulation protein D (sporulation-specific penicillin-binding protein)